MAPSFFGTSSQGMEPASGEGTFLARDPSPMKRLPSRAVQVGPAPCVPTCAAFGSSLAKSAASGAVSFHSAPDLSARAVQG